MAPPSSPSPPPALQSFQVLTAFGLNAEVSDLSRQFLGYPPTTPDWSTVLDARIAVGEPLPDLPKPETGPPDEAEPAKHLVEGRK